jgi:hypothetical protein
MNGLKVSGGRKYENIPGTKVLITGMAILHRQTVLCSKSPELNNVLSIAIQSEVPDQCRIVQASFQSYACIGEQQPTEYGRFRLLMRFVNPFTTT